MELSRHPRGGGKGDLAGAAREAWDQGHAGPEEQQWLSGPGTGAAAAMYIHGDECLELMKRVPPRAEILSTQTLCGIGGTSGVCHHPFERRLELTRQPRGGGKGDLAGTVRETRDQGHAGPDARGQEQQWLRLFAGRCNGS